MQDVLAEAAGELVPVVGQALAAVALTLAGAAAELNGLSSMTGGEVVVGAWLCYMGGVALYAGLFALGPNVLDELSARGVTSAE